MDVSFPAIAADPIRKWLPSAETAFVFTDQEADGPAYGCDGEISKLETGYHPSDRWPSIASRTYGIRAA